MDKEGEEVEPSAPTAEPEPSAPTAEFEPSAPTAEFEPVPAPHETLGVDRDTGGFGTTTINNLALFDSELLAPLFFTFLFLSATAALIFVLFSFVADLVMSFILVGLFSGVYVRIRRKLVKNAWVASGLTTLLVMLVIVGPLVGLIWTIASEASSFFDQPESLSEQFSGLVDQAAAAAGQVGLPVTRPVLLGYLDELTVSLRDAAVSVGSAIVANVIGITVHLLTMLVMIFYILVDGHRLRKFLFDLSPLPDDEDALLEKTFAKVAKGVVVGQGFGSAIQGVIGGLAFWVVGLPSPILWGTVMALFAFLPLVGVTAVAIPAGLYLIFTGHAALGIGFIVFNVLQGTIIDNVVKTKMIGSAMRMHDLLVFLSVLGGISAFGLIGVVYGPLIAMFFMTLYDLYDRIYRPKLARRMAAGQLPRLGHR